VIEAGISRLFLNNLEHPPIPRWLQNLRVKPGGTFSALIFINAEHARIVMFSHAFDFGIVERGAQRPRLRQFP
jgi:hypothetical protein